MKSIFVFAIFLGYASAQTPCPAMETVYNLDLEKYMGNWNVHAIVNVSEPIGEYTCYTSTMNEFSPGGGFTHQPVALKTHVMWNIPDDNPMHDVPLTVENLYVPGRWKWVEYNVTSTAYVLYTDYVEFSLFVVCRDNTADLMEAHFLSRFENPIPTRVVDIFKNLLTSYGIDTKNYKEIPCAPTEDDPHAGHVM